MPQNKNNRKKQGAVEKLVEHKSMAVIKPKPQWIIKGCPKCSGDLNREDDYYYCLQCGYVHWDTPPLILVRKDELADKKIK